MSTLFSPATQGTLTLQNHLAMSPLTRNRAMGNMPNDLMAELLAPNLNKLVVMADYWRTRIVVEYPLRTRWALRYRY